VAATDWVLREISAQDRQRFLSEGWWTTESLGDRLTTRLAQHHDQAFVIHSATRPWRGTFGDVLDYSARVATGLAALGVRSGDVVSFQTPNWLEGVATFYGAAMLGAVVAPVVHIYGVRELSYILEACQPRVHVTASAFGHQNYLANLEGVREIEGLQIVVVDGDAPPGMTTFRSFESESPLHSVAAVDPAMPALVGWTSGTTAHPKGVIHSHETVLSEVRQLGATSPITDRPIVIANPISHAIGMLGSLLIPVDKGTAVHLLDVWDPTVVLEIMLTEELSTGGGAPYFLTSLLDHPDFSERHLALMPFQGMGGAPVPRAVTDRATALGIHVYRMYGSTEHPSITGCTRDDPLEKRLGTDGQPLAGNEVRLIDADQRDVGRGEPGEILSRGPELFLGYTDPQLTAKVFDADGWYHTGDIGIFDEDGYLAITDRVSDVIIRGGENISAAEIEEVLLGLRGVAEVAVVAAPDVRLGEHAVAVIRTLPDHAMPSLANVRTHLEHAGLARQKWPEEILQVEDFPRTTSGKVQKFVLRQQLLQR
jgi:acyl-CoA synthetase